MPKHTLDDVNSYVHYWILKKTEVTWSNCTAARSTLPYTCGTKNVNPPKCQSTILNDITWRLPSQTNDVRMRAPSVRMSNIVQRETRESLCKHHTSLKLAQHPLLVIVTPCVCDMTGVIVLTSCVCEGMSECVTTHAGVWTYGGFDIRHGGQVEGCLGQVYYRSRSKGQKVKRKQLYTYRFYINCNRPTSFVREIK